MRENRLPQGMRPERISRTVSFVLVLIVVIPLLSGCVIGRHPVGIASSTTPLNSDYTVLGPAERSSCRNWFLGIPLGGMSNTQELIDELVKEKGGEALVGVTVEYSGEVFALPVVGASCLNIKGLAVRSEK